MASTQSLSKNFNFPALSSVQKSVKILTNNAKKKENDDSGDILDGLVSPALLKNDENRKGLFYYLIKNI